MKHWKEKQSGGISLNDCDGDMRTFSIKCFDNGDVRFREECDRYFAKFLTKREAIAALVEAIEHIQSANTPDQARR